MPPLANLQPEAYLFADDGRIPNSRLPVLLYRSNFPATQPDPAAWFEHRFTTQLEFIAQRQRYMNAPNQSGSTEQAR